MTDREAISNFEKRNFWLKANPCCQRIQSRVDKQNGEIERNEAAISALRERMEREGVTDTNVGDNWISVERELPEETGSYLVFYHEWSDGAFLPTYEDCKIRVMRFLDSRKWCYPVCVDKRCEADTHREVTHWQPLPKPPKDSGEDTNVPTNTRPTAENKT